MLTNVNSVHKHILITDCNISEVMDVVIDLNAYVSPPSTLMEHKHVRRDKELHNIFRNLKKLLDYYNLEGKSTCFFQVQN